MAFETLFLEIFDSRLSIVQSAYDCHLPGVNKTVFFFFQNNPYYIELLCAYCFLNLGPYCLQPGRVAQSVTCLAIDAGLTADPGFASSIPARSHTFVEIDYKIMSMVILLTSAELFK